MVTKRTARVSAISGLKGRIATVEADILAEAREKTKNGGIMCNGQVGVGT